MVFTMYTII